MPSFVQWLKRQTPDSDNERINALILLVRVLATEEMEEWDYYVFLAFLLVDQTFAPFIEATHIMGQHYQKYVAITYPNSILAD